MNTQTQIDAPLVTIIIPSYNHQDYIQDCVMSVCGQDYSNLQIIVIDDGSTDSSVEILNTLAQEQPFQLLTQKNKGLATTLNIALAMAKGKYFCTMGSDDVMLPGKTSAQLAYMEKNPDVAACGGNVHYINAKGERLTKHEKRLCERTLNFEELFTSTKKGIAAPTAMFRTDILRKLGGYDPSSKLEDLPLWLKLTHMGHLIGAIDDFVLQYRKHDTNTYKNLPMMVTAITDAYALYSEHPDYQKIIQRFHCSMFLKAAKNEPDLAWSLFKKIHPRHYNSKIPRAMGRLLATIIQQHLRK